MISYITVMCKVCRKVCEERNTCECGNMGLITDTDGHINIYVEDLTTTQRVVVYCDDNGRPITKELLNTFSTALQVKYGFADEPFLTRYTVKKEIPKYDRKLRKKLERKV